MNSFPNGNRNQRLPFLGMVGNGNSCTPLIVGQWNVAHSRDSILQELFFDTARAWNMNCQGQKNISTLWQDKAKQGEWNMVGQTPGGRWSMTCGEMKGPPICLKKGKRNKRQENQGLKDNWGWKLYGKVKKKLTRALKDRRKWKECVWGAWGPVQCWRSAPLSGFALLFLWSVNSASLSRPHVFLAALNWI